MGPGQTGPDPSLVSDLPELARQFDLLRARAARGSGRPKVSLAELTRRLGLPPTSKSTVHSYVSGKTLAPAEMLDEMVIALGATTAEQRAWADAWYRISAAPRRKARYSPQGLPDPPEHLGPDFVGRGWAFDRIDRWHRDGGSVLVVTGEPGAGKSALVGRLVGSGGFVSAAHYCRAQVTESLDAAAVIRSLARQLRRNVPGYAPPGEEALSAETEPRQLYDKAIRQPLRSAGTAAVIVIDALDEAVEGGGGYGLVTLLARESRMPAVNLRLVVTSRPGRALRHFAATSRFDLIEDEADAGGDVRAYAEQRLRAGGVPAADVLARRIASRGKGNFLYARFVLDDLLGRDEPVTTGSIRLPDGLAELYREFLNREIAAVEPDWRLRYRPVLGLLTQARGDGFTADQLVSLTGLARSAVEDALTVCAPYLRGHGPYQIFHQSFRDYLHAPGEHHVYPAEAAQRILDELCRGLLEPYAVRHLPRHVVDAARLGVADHARAALERALEDLDFLSAKAVADSADLVAGLGDAVAAAGAPTGRAARMWRLLSNQAHNLRRWPAARHPAFLLQQLHYEATAAGLGELRAGLEAYLSRRGIRRLRVDWTVIRPGEGHADSVTTVAVSGRHTATGSYDHTVRIWDEDGTVLRILDHPGPVQQVVALPGGWVASTCEDHVVRVWTLDGSGRELAHPDTVGPMAVAPNGWLVAGCADGIARMWDVDEAAVRHELIHDDRVGCVAVAGEAVVTGSDDGSAYLWELASGRLVRHFDHRDPVTLVLADGNRVVTVAGERRITLWDRESGDRLRSFEAPARVRAVAVRGGLVAASGNRVLRWHLDRDAPPEELAGHDDIIHGFVLAGADLLTFGRDNVARLSTVDGVPRVLPHDDWVRDAAVVGEAVVTVSDDRTARWWDRGSGAPLRVLAGNADSVRTIAIEPGGRWVASGSDDGTVAVRNLRTGALLREFRHDGLVRAVAATGDTVISGSDDHTVRMWNVHTGQCVATLRTSGPVRAIATAPELVVAASDDHLVRVWHGDCVVLRGHSDIVRAVAVSAGFVVSGSRDTTAIVWSRRSPARPAHVLRHPAWVRGVVITPDERQVATSCVDGVVRVWNLHSGQLAGELAGHEGAVRDIRVTADGTRLVTASGDRTARVWDLRDWREAHRLRHDSWVRSAQLTPDDRYAVTTSDDRTARVWSMRTGRELHRIAASHRIACCALRPGRLVFGTSRGEICCAAVPAGEE